MAKQCQLCEDTAATLFCKQCNESFCSECFEALHWSGKRQGHEVFPVGAASGGAAPPPAGFPQASPQMATRPPAPMAAPSPGGGVPIGGVGLFLKPNERQELEIVRLAKGGSAERSGQILPGDIVFEVDGQDVYKKDFNVFAKLIQGPIGTFVEVKVFKQGDYSRVSQVVLERTLNPEDARPPQQQLSPQQPSMAPGGPRQQVVQQVVSRQVITSSQQITSSSSQQMTSSSSHIVSGSPPRPGGGAGGDIGIEFKTDETGCFQITGLKPGGPAQQSGQVDVGDILYEIEGVKVLYGIGPNGRPLSHIEIAEMLRGPEGSVMNLRLQKGRMGRLATVNLTRSMGNQSSATRGAMPVQQQQQFVAPPSPPQQMIQQQAPPPPPQQQQMQQPAFNPPQGPPSGMYGTQQSGYQEPLVTPDQYPQSQQHPMPYQPQNQMMGPPMQQMQHHHMQQQPPQGMFGPPPPAGVAPWALGPPPPQGMMGPPMGEQQPFDPFKIPDYVDEYDPKQPDRFGLGIVFQPYGQGQIRVRELIPGGPAERSKEPIHVGDWLYEVDGKMVFKRPVSETLKLLQAKQKGDPVHLGLRHSGDRHLTGVMIYKGKTGVKLSNAGVGIVFKQDPPPATWVRVAQVIPEGPAFKSLGEGVIRVNDRVVEINGINVVQKDLKEWQHMLKGKEGTSCIITFSDVNADLYSANIVRGFVDQNTVDQKSINVPAPLYEAPVKIRPKYLAPDKKYLPNMSGQSCGIAFLVNDEGEVVVDHVTKGGPAAQVGQITPGDVLLEIGDGPDVDPVIFPMREVYRMPIETWSEIIKKGVPQTHCKMVFKKAYADEKYEVLVKRELMVDLDSGAEKLYMPGCAFAAHGKHIYVDQGGILPLSSAAKEGVREGYILVAIERDEMVGKIDDLMPRMNELLLGPLNTPVNLIFKTAAGNIKFRVLRDVPVHNTATRGPPKPRMRVERERPKPTILPFNTAGLGPGSGVYTQPMSNPVLWASLVEEGQAMEGDESRFQWRGRILKQPEYDEHGIATVVDGITNELLYRGPGLKEKRLPGMRLPNSTRNTGAKGGSAFPQSAPPQKSAAPPRQMTPPAETPAKAPSPEAQRPSPEAQRPSPSTPWKPPSPVAAPAPAPAPTAPGPTIAATPAAAPSASSPPPTDGVDPNDDEKTLILTDGRTVEAQKLEEVLKRHLDAVAYVMVVGSKKPFLSCMLTLKTHGSEAAEEGKDPKSVPNPFDLAAPALQLAKKVGSSAVNVHQARQDQLFRANGLLPAFSAANQEIGDSAMQVRRFSILTSFFTQATGELNQDGSLARLKIKKTHKHIIDGMYQQKKPAPPPA